MIFQLLIVEFIATGSVAADGYRLSRGRAVHVAAGNTDNLSRENLI
jgi:hypothetical protein